MATQASQQLSVTNEWDIWDWWVSHGVSAVELPIWALYVMDMVLETSNEAWDPLCAVPQLQCTHVFHFPAVQLLTITN